MPYLFFDPLLLLFLAPAILLGMFAQWWVNSAYARAAQVRARLNGASAARLILDSAGLQHVEIEPTHGYLSDHYDPRHKVLRLSPDVYQGYSLAAVGIAAHEAGHAIQDARGYIPLVVRNAAVPLAGFGSNIGVLLIILGLVFSGSAFGPYLAIAGLGLFGCVVFSQVVNLPVEFDASARAKRQLVDLGIVDEQEMGYVRNVLRAAALTYVAATLQSVLTLLYYALRVLGGSRHRD
jgi:Zn-dependent membrane protease YugP